MIGVLWFKHALCLKSLTADASAKDAIQDATLKLNAKWACGKREWIAFRELIRFCGLLNPRIS